MFSTSKVGRLAVPALASGPASAAGDVEPLQWFSGTLSSASFLAALCLVLIAIFYSTRWLIHLLLRRIR
ncbi:hypothetical protein DK427_01960 [Methylobacterium radiodurans]|uniref:Uncharacterized protein n=1 Tax=Methylobacterium radiodurans TaxID=2202828 RepID=A0A2U8VM24_9HYPH|nr:hypothetical protein DK427_01960 [Methylobacterium radiodurans]